MNIRKKIESVVMILASIVCITTITYAHSGRTDSSGGHKDNKNKSGLGSYHYHCGGHPAHLHPNGVCPYSSSATKKSTTNSTNKQKTNSSSNSSNSQSTKKSTSTKPATILAESIKINEEAIQMEIGDKKTLTTTISPNNTTDKTIIWKSNDETIATISTSGEVIAKKAGTVTITASTKNGKTASYAITVKEEKQAVTTSTQNKAIATNTMNNPNNSDNSNNSEAIAGGVATVALGGAGYVAYKKYKKNKNNKLF